VKVELGTVQETLFIPLAARARETRGRRPLLRTRRRPRSSRRLISTRGSTAAAGAATVIP